MQICFPSEKNVGIAVRCNNITVIITNNLTVIYYWNVQYIYFMYFASYYYFAKLLELCASRKEINIQPVFYYFQKGYFGYYL